MIRNKTCVLLVSPLVSGVVGGIAKWTNNIYNYYETCVDSNIRLIPCYNKEIHNPLSDDGCIARIYKGVNNYLPLIKQVRSELNNNQIDVVHICTSASLGLLKDLAIIKLAKKKGKKVIVHFHFGRIPTIFKHSNWERLLIKKVIEMSDTQIVMDMASLNTLKSLNYKNVCYIPNPLSSDTERCIEQNQNVSRVPNKIIFVGQMLQSKGIYELAQACSDIQNIKLHYIGPLPDTRVKEKLGTLIDESKMVIHDSMPFESVIKEMQSSSLFVLPTYSEGFPNVIIESMACGCPIIATPVGAIPEMLDIYSNQKCGLCVPPKNVDELKSAIIQSLNNPSDSLQMGERARQRVRSKYSISSVWNLLNDVWQL